MSKTCVSSGEHTKSCRCTDTDINIRRWWEVADLELNTTPDPPEGTTWPSTSEYFPEATISGNVYVDLLQHTFIDNSERFTSGLVDEKAQWVRVLVARDFGLVQYELLNGTVYTLDQTIAKQTFQMSIMLTGL